jgi:hypothetical protein
VGCFGSFAAYTAAKIRQLHNVLRITQTKMLLVETMTDAGQYAIVHLLRIHDFRSFLVRAILAIDPQLLSRKPDRNTMNNRNNINRNEFTDLSITIPRPRDRVRVRSRQSNKEG